jgi:hypothetical protein
MAHDRPIFVVGCPRSGTTMLQLMLHAHPRIAVPPENRHVLPAWERRADFGDMHSAANRRRLGEFITGTRSFRYMKLNKGAVLDAVVAAPPTLGSVLEAVMREFAAAHGKARWCDKRPAYLHYTDVILRLFPEAQFVHLIRDGRSCAASLKRVPWWRGGTRGATVQWASVIDHGRLLRRRMPADTWYELQYERLVADPKTELQRLCAYLGEDFEPAMLAPQEKKKEIIPKRQVWHANTAGGPSEQRVAQWKDELEHSELQLFEWVARRQLRAYGYPVGGDLGRPPAAALAGYYRLRAFREARHVTRVARDAVASRREPPVATLFGSGTRSGPPSP